MTSTPLGEDEKVAALEWARAEGERWGVKANYSSRALLDAVRLIRALAPEDTGKAGYEDIDAWVRAAARAGL